MKIFSYINNDIERIKKEVRIGILPYSIFCHWQIYAKYDSYKKMGQSTKEAVINIRKEFNICEKTVFNIISKMEAEI